MFVGMNFILPRNPQKKWIHQICKFSSLVFCWLSLCLNTMQSIPKNKLLEHHPDTLMSIRKEYNLDKPGAMEDAVRIVREWIQAQPHFKKKDFKDVYLEIVIYACKGSLERTKKQIDKMCTVRTLLPQFYDLCKPKTDLGMLFDVFYPAFLPKLTPNHERVFILKINEKVHLCKNFLDYFIYGIMLCDYVKIHDICLSYIVIFDFVEMNIMDFIANLNPVQFKQFFSVFIDGYGMRLKGIHIFTPSKLVDVFITVLKQALNPKVANRIYSYKSLESITDAVPLDILPEEYGGKEKPLKIICDEWVEELSSEEYLNYLRDLKKAGTDESCRQNNEFNENYAGMPGTFRVLSVD